MSGLCPIDVVASMTWIPRFPPSTRGTDLPDPGTVCSVDIRIGVTQAPRELTVEMPDDERDETVATIEAAMSGQSEVLWLIDKRGRRVGVPAAKIAYVEVGTSDGDRRIGFG